MLLSQWIFEEDEQTAKDRAKETGLTILNKVETSENMLMAEKVQEWINSWIMQNLEKFKSSAIERYGWIQDDGYAILPSALEPDLKKAGFNPRAVLSELKDTGRLKTTENRLKTKISIDGEKIWVIYYLKEEQEVEFF